MSIKVNGELKQGTSFASKVTVRNKTIGTSKDYWRARYAAPGCNASPKEKYFPYTAEGLVAAQDWLGSMLPTDVPLPLLEPLPDPKPMEPSPSLWEAVERLAVAGQYWEASRVAFVGARCLAAQCRDCG